MVSVQVPVSWEPVSVEPIKTPDGKVSVPEEVITSMTTNKIGLKGTQHAGGLWGKVFGGRTG